MASPENENPYQSPKAKESVTSNASEVGFQLTALETLLMIVLAIVVAVPVFFTPCIGGGFAVVSINPPSGRHNYGPDATTLTILSIVSLLLAVRVGFVVGRWFYRKRRRRASSGYYR